MVVVAIVGVLSGMAGLAIQSWNLQSRAKATARDMADLVLQARAESIRSGVQHLLLFANGPDGNPLLDGDGNAVAAMLVRDADGDGKPDAGEPLTVLPIDDTGTLAWGVSLANEIAPGDPNSVPGAAPASPWAFAQPGGAAANWIAFFPDGTPRGYSIDPFTAGQIGSGGGAVYVTANLGNDASDYAVVVTPLGAIRVHAWDRSAAAWRN